MIPTNDRRSREPHVVILVAAILLCVTGLVVAGLLALADHLAPQVGDIIAFPPSNRPSISTASITVSPAVPRSHATCVLDVPVMQRFGGSLVIEATQSKPARNFLVHWAGLLTSHGRDSCGDSADLLLDSAQMAELIFAAGGTGAKTARE